MNFCTVWLTLKWPRTTFFYNGIEWYSLFDNDVQHSSANSTKHRFIQVQYDFGSVQSMKLVIVVNLSIQQLELQLLSMVSYPLTATVGGLALLLLSIPSFFTYRNTHSSFTNFTGTVSILCGYECIFSSKNRLVILSQAFFQILFT